MGGNGLHVRHPRDPHRLLRLISTSMLGSLQWYRTLLYDHVFFNPAFTAGTPAPVQETQFGVEDSVPKLPTIGHAVAGFLAGSTVSVIASPVEHIKARLQIQYAAKRNERFYSGPIDCMKKIVCHGLDCRPGLLANH